MLKEKIESIKRVGGALSILFPIVIMHMRDAKRFILFGSPRDLSIDEQRERARMLTDAFEELGVTYIKMAQFLTTRPDYVPPLYLEEFQRLQDEVPPEPFENIKPMLEEDLGKLEDVFDLFEEEAISGASIAQVHKAVIDGETVAVKVRRPGIERIIDADLRVISFMVVLISGFLKWNGHTAIAETIKGLSKEMEKNLNDEIDFEREKSIMQEVYDKVKEDGVDDIIVIPRPYDDYCTKRIITMTYEDGVKIKHVDKIKEMGLDIEEIVDRIVEAYLRMAFVYRVYQADPHDGNIAVNENGQVVIYDYGLSVRPTEKQSEAFIRMFTGIGMEEPDVVLKAFEDLGAIDPTMNRKTLREFCEVIIKDVAGEVTKEEIDHLEERVDETLQDAPMKLPQNIVLSMRTTTGVQGLSVRVAPEYDFKQKLAEFFIREGLVDIDVDEIKEEARNRTVDVSLIRQEVKEELQRYNKRTVMSVFGSASLVLAVLLFLQGATLWMPMAAVGGAFIFLVLFSYRGKDEVTGPKHMAMRYRMNRWYETEAAPQSEEKVKAEA